MGAVQHERRGVRMNDVGYGWHGGGDATSSLFESQLAAVCGCVGRVLGRLRRLCGSGGRAGWGMEGFAVQPLRRLGRERIPCNSCGVDGSSRTHRIQTPCAPIPRATRLESLGSGVLRICLGSCVPCVYLVGLRNALGYGKKTMSWVGSKDAILYDVGGWISRC
jgi:hypothetical protein